MKERWLITYSSRRNGFPTSDVLITTFHDGTLEEFVKQEESRNEDGVRRYYIVIHFAVKL